MQHETEDATQIDARCKKQSRAILCNTSISLIKEY